MGRAPGEGIPKQSPERRIQINHKTTPNLSSKMVASVKPQRSPQSKPQYNRQIDLQNVSAQGLQDLQFIGQSPFKEMVSFEAFLMGESTRGRHSQRKAQKKDPTSTQNNPNLNFKMVASVKPQRSPQSKPQHNRQIGLQNGSFQGLQNPQFIGQSPFKEMVSFEAFLMGESTRERHPQTKSQKKDPNSPQNNPKWSFKIVTFNMFTVHNTTYTTDKLTSKIVFFKGFNISNSYVDHSSKKWSVLRHS